MQLRLKALAAKTPGSSSMNRGWYQALLVAAAVAVMIWLGAASDTRETAYSFKGRRDDYYNRLVEGFLQGHLYFDVETPPSAQGGDAGRGANPGYLLDASRYHGKWYLYYGVVPAALVLLPYRLATGQELSLNVAVLLFWGLGFSASLIWFRRWVRDYLPSIGWVYRHAAFVILLAVPATVFLVRRSAFYELPIVGGYGFICVLFTAIYEVFQGRRVAAMLALASTAYGLSVGCHPNHILLGPIILWAALARPRDGARTSVLPRLAAAILPAFAVGLALGWYNLARFGSPFDFGYKYGANQYWASHSTIFQAQFLWPNFRWYFLTPPSVAPYFPFIFPGEVSFGPNGLWGGEPIHGQFPVSVLVCFALGGFLLWRAWRSPLAAAFAIALAYAVLAALAFLCPIAIRADRYLVDFQTPLAFLLVVITGAAWSRVGQRMGAVLWKTAIVLLVGATAAFDLLASIQQFDLFRNTRPKLFGQLSSALDVPYPLLYQAGLGRPGYVTMRVKFPHLDHATVGPLIATGTPFYSDGVYVAQYPNDYIEVLVDHFGELGHRSRLMRVDPAKEYTIDVSLGSLYPPAGDRYFRGWNPDTVRALKHTSLVRVDGGTVIDLPMVFFEAPPWAVFFGENRITLNEYGSKFKGRILSTEVNSPPSPREDAALFSSSAIRRFTITLPVRASNEGMPLLSMGVTGSGHLLFLRPEGDGYRFALDDWGIGASLGELVSPTPGSHVLDLAIGPLLTERDLPAGLGSEDLRRIHSRLAVWLDGKSVGSFELVHHLDHLNPVYEGANPQGFSTAAPLYQGQIDRALVARDVATDILRREVDAASSPDGR